MKTKPENLTTIVQNLGLQFFAQHYEDLGARSS
jgi:hypothetical protein